MVNMHEAKTHLSKLVERVQKGEEIIIAKAGKPVAKIVPYRDEMASKQQRQPGLLAGKIWLAEDWEAPLPDDIIDLFYGEGDPGWKDEA
jgi:prevent-host-death family protein